MKKKEYLASQIWEQINQKTHYLVADILNRTLPLPNLRDKKIFNLYHDTDYRNLLTDFGDMTVDLNYKELRLRAEEDLEPLPEQIAYHYLLLVIKSLVNEMRSFGCHNESYLNF